MSHGYYTSVFHYRQDVYDELELEVPEGIEEMIGNVRIIDESDLDIRGYGLAGKAQNELQVLLSNMGTSGIGVRWVDGDVGGELEIQYPEDKVVKLLEYFQELAQYSPDPTGIGWAESLGSWAGGRFAQQYNLNMSPAGVAASAGAENIAKNTGVAPLPR